ncbi:STAS domain-containing protein [bacterium LRH843]|nr:STAS domain-containing protein [bacterium LRH843]
MNITIRKELENNEMVVYLAGEIDVYSAPQLRETLVPLSKQKGKHVIVDLSDIQYIDSTGLGIFIGALKAAHANKGELKLRGMSERVQRLFSITGLDEVMTISKCKEEELQ